MKPAEELFCKLIRQALHPGGALPFSRAERLEIASEINTIYLLAREHNMQSALYDSLCTLKIPLPPALQDEMRQTVVSYSLASYRMLGFTRKILSVLAEENVHYILLKGVSLLECYPKLEFRGYGDVDILIPEKNEFEQVKNRFLAEGFYIKEDYVDHQLELFFEENGKRHLLELHSKVIASQEDKQMNEAVQQLFGSLRGVPGSLPAAGLCYRVFPPTENTLYLLLHMLQHFLNSGFGIKLLCDWTVYIEAHHEKIDWKSYDRLTASLGLTGFSHAMAQLCIRYCGLPPEYIPLSDAHKISAEAQEELIADIMKAGEFGKNDSSRMLIMTQGGNLFHYLQQLHRQMKNRFPEIQRIVILWPILWLLTGICFLWNNHALRKTSTREVLATTRKRHHLIQEMDLFQR